MEKQIYKQFYEIEKSHWWFRGMYRLCRDLLRRCLNGAASAESCIIGDIGCGTGRWAENLSDKGTVVAIDNSIEALAICRERLLDNLVCADAYFLPIEEESLNIVTALNIIEHVSDEKKIIDDIWRVLKPGGHCLILTSAFMFLWGQHDELAHHKRRYRKKELAAIFAAAGFEVVKCSYANTFMFPVIAVSRLLEKFSRKKYQDGQPSRDFFIPPFPVNEILYRLLNIESCLLRWADMPFGVSLVLLLKKKG